MEYGTLLNIREAQRQSKVHIVGGEINQGAKSRRWSKREGLLLNTWSLRY